MHFLWQSKEPKMKKNKMGKRKASIQIKTLNIGGRFQHDLKYTGRLEDISNEVVNMLKEVNEKLWKDISDGYSSNLVSKIGYTISAKRK